MREKVETARSESSCCDNVSSCCGTAKGKRVLKPGGRIMISDMVLLKELPDAVMNPIEAYIGCLSGAIMKDDYVGGIKAAGFQEVEVFDETSSSLDCMANDPTAQAVIGNLDLSPEELKEAAGSVISVKVSGIKPEN